MKRRVNVFIRLGFLLILAGVFSYLPIFVRFPSTRDFPWANLLLFVTGDALIILGLVRAFREPQRYGGKVSGLILEALATAVLGLFIIGFSVYARRLPASRGAPQVGQKAPDFTLPDKDGNPVTLSKLLSPAANSPAGGAARTNGVVLIFYRGYW